MTVATIVDDNTWLKFIKIIQDNKAQNILVLKFLKEFTSEHNAKHRIQITYRMFTPIGANGKLLTLNFHIDTGAATSSQNN